MATAIAAAATTPPARDEDIEMDETAVAAFKRLREISKSNRSLIDSDESLLDAELQPDEFVNVHPNNSVVTNGGAVTISTAEDSTAKGNNSVEEGLGIELQSNEVKVRSTSTSIDTYGTMLTVEDSFYEDDDVSSFLGKQGKSKKSMMSVAFNDNSALETDDTDDQTVLTEVASVASRKLQESKEASAASVSCTTLLENLHPDNLQPDELDTTCFDKVICAYPDSVPIGDRMVPSDHLIEKILCRADEALYVCKVNDKVNEVTEYVDRHTKSKNNGKTKADTSSITDTGNEHHHHHPALEDTDETGSMSSHSIVSSDSSGILNIAAAEEEYVEPVPVEGRRVSTYSTSAGEEVALDLDESATLKFTREFTSLNEEDGEEVEENDDNENDELNTTNITSAGEEVALEEQTVLKEEEPVGADRQAYDLDLRVTGSGDEFELEQMVLKKEQEKEEDEKPELQEQIAVKEAPFVGAETTPVVTILAPDSTPIVAEGEKTHEKEEGADDTTSASPAPPGAMKKTKAEAVAVAEANPQEQDEEKIIAVIESITTDLKDVETVITPIRVQKLLKEAYRPHMSEEALINESSLLLEHYAGKEDRLIAALEEKARVRQSTPKQLPAAPAQKERNEAPSKKKKKKKNKNKNKNKAKSLMKKFKVFSKKTMTAAL